MRKSNIHEYKIFHRRLKESRVILAENAEEAVNTLGWEWDDCWIRLHDFTMSTPGAAGLDWRDITPKESSDGYSG